MSVVPCLPAHLCVSPQRPVAGPPRERVTTVWMDYLKKKNISLDVKDVLVHLVADVAP